jgi:SpoVK/Ycf46/Vps4 family AAA+-type ATPase
MMARAMATSGRANFIAVKGPELFSKFVGDSEKAVAEVFSRARAAAPCVVFFDEFDALAAARDGDGEGEGGGGASVRVVAQLLVELDGVAGAGVSGAGLVVVAATNRPDLIDAALLRPGRMDALLYVGLPDIEARAAMAATHLMRIPCSPDVTPAAVAAAMEGYSGAEVVGAIRDASLRAANEAIGRGGDFELQLEWRHLRAALDAAPPQVTSEVIAWYNAWSQGNAGAYPE